MGRAGESAEFPDDRRETHPDRDQPVLSVFLRRSPPSLRRRNRHSGRAVAGPAARPGLSAVHDRLTESKAGARNRMRMVDLAGTPALAGTAASAQTKALPAQRERAWVLLALLGLVLLAAGLRVVPTVFVPSLNWGD